MIGARLGNWIIEKELGRGGMSHVYLARRHHDALPSDSNDQGLGNEPQRAAIKVLVAELAQEPGFVHRFEREIELLHTLKHPNIVKFYESGQHDGRYYYAMEYVDGPSCEALLQQRGRLHWDEVLDLALQICPALKHAHDHGIIHRDLKPANLLVGKDSVIKLADFGIAKVFAGTQLTATTGVVGTAAYLSPEQAAGKRVTERSDLYSLGVVLYTLVTGRTPFEADSMVAMLQKHRYGRFDPPQKFVPELPRDFNAMICQLLEKEPDRRPPNALVLARQFEQLRRKLARKGQATADILYHDETVVEEGGQTDEVRPAGLSTLMNWLMRAEAEALKRTGPLSRLFNRAWFLLLLLAGVAGLLIWGLWPVDVQTIFREAEQAVAERDWGRASEKLDQLDHRDHPYHERAADLREQIHAGRLGQQARSKLAVAGPGPFSKPSSAAEQFYSEGVQAYRSGQYDEARRKWQRIVDAFSGIESQKPWVVLAQEALAASETSNRNLAAIEEAIRLAKTDPPDQAKRRLKALADLYDNRQDDMAKAVHARIERALQELAKARE